MGYVLRSGLSFCQIDGRAVFVDLTNDRYFTLSKRLQRSIDALLDRAEPSVSDGVPQLLIRQGIIVEGEDPDQRLSPCPPVIRTNGIANDCPAVDWLELCRLGVAIIQFTLWLRAFGLESSLAALFAEPERGGQIASGSSHLRSVVGQFIRLKALLRSKDCCLPFAMALTSRLRRHGFGAKLVFGVCVKPFAAHCWVQVDETVVSDNLEDLRIFTPILVR